jgi:hypothetical protein
MSGNLRHLIREKLVKFSTKNNPILTVHKKRNQRFSLEYCVAFFWGEMKINGFVGGSSSREKLGNGKKVK